MSKKIITISREFGSGGHYIGEETARKLGIPFYDKEIIEKIAKETGFSKDFIEKQSEYAPSKNPFSYAFIGRDTDGSSLSDKIYAAQSRIILELAEKESCIIIGRCADYILKDNPDAIHLFIHGNTATKQARIEKLYQKDAKEALALMHEMDKKRSLNYNYYTDRKWGNLSNYTMTLNSSVLDYEQCIGLIVSLFS